MKVHWVCQQFMLDRAIPGFPNLAGAARQAGHDVTITKFEEVLKGPIPIPADSCVISYGTHQFISLVQKMHEEQWHPCAFHYLPRLKYTGFSYHLKPHLLNDDYVILPLGELHLRGVKTPTFVRPNEALKEFTPRVVDPTTSLSLANDPDILCVLASPKEILGEYRYIIADHEVVTGSQYRWSGKLDIRTDTHSDCDALARSIADQAWQPDVVYTCDIALTPNGPKVIELNPFSCSGLYACDTVKIVDAVSRAAWKEFALV